LSKGGKGVWGNKKFSRTVKKRKAMLVGPEGEVVRVELGLVARKHRPHKRAEKPKTLIEKNVGEGKGSDCPLGRRGLGVATRHVAIIFAKTFWCGVKKKNDCWGREGKIRREGPELGVSLPLGKSVSTK